MQDATLGDRLFSIRGRRSRRAFAAQYGIHEQSLVRYENGLRQPDNDFIRRVCDGEKISLEWLLTGEGDGNGQKTADVSDSSGDGCRITRHSETECSTPATVKKPATCRRFLEPPQTQPLDFSDSEKKKTCDGHRFCAENDSSPDLVARCLRLADEVARLLRENGDLRVAVERQKARIAELERLGAAGEREGGNAALARLELENRELRVSVQQLRQALAAAPTVTDALQNDIPPAPGRSPL